MYDSLGDKILTLTKTWLFRSYCDLESKVKVTKTYHTFGTLLDMKLHQFGKNLSIGSRDRVESSEINISKLMKIDSFSKRDAEGLTKYFEARKLKWDITKVIILNIQGSYIGLQ